jgi:hypothetical protein
MGNEEHNAELRESIRAARIHLKGTIRSLRGSLQFLADVERCLDESDAEPMEAERNGQDRRTAEARISG